MHIQWYCMINNAISVSLSLIPLRERLKFPLPVKWLLPGRAYLIGWQRISWPVLVGLRDSITDSHCWKRTEQFQLSAVECCWMKNNFSEYTVRYNSLPKKRVSLCVSYRHVAVDKSVTTSPGVGFELPMCTYLFQPTDCYIIQRLDYSVPPLQCTRNPFKS